MKNCVGRWTRLWAAGRWPRNCTRYANRGRRAVGWGIPSETQAALAIWAGAQQYFLSGSYFGYLHVLDFVEKFDEKAQEVLQAQKLHLLEVIEKLKPKSSQLWGHYDNGQWIDGDGDIDAHHLRRYAPNQWRELDSSIKDVQIAWKLETRNWVTYSIYRQVELSLRKCIRLGFATIELALDKRESKELSTLRTATILLLLWPLVITHIASFAIWDWGAARPGSPRKLLEYIGTILVAQLIALLNVVVVLVALFSWLFAFSYSNQKKQVRERYLAVKTSLTKA